MLTGNLSTPARLHDCYAASEKTTVEQKPSGFSLQFCLRKRLCRWTERIRISARRARIGVDNEVHRERHTGYVSNEQVKRILLVSLACRVARRHDTQMPTWRVPSSEAVHQDKELLRYTTRPWSIALQPVQCNVEGEVK